MNMRKLGLLMTNKAYLTNFVKRVWGWYGLLAVVIGYFAFFLLFSKRTGEWASGKTSGCLLLLIALSIPFLTRGFRGGLKFKKNDCFYVIVLLIVGCVIAFYWHIDVLQQYLLFPQINDIPGRTLAAINSLVAGQNPYALSMPPREVLASEALYKEGFVYMPLMIFVYMPLGLLWGARGMLATNFIMESLVVVLLFLLGKKISSTAAGLLAGLLFLLTWLVPYELYGPGVTDVAAVVLLLAGMLFFGRKSGWAGFFVGLSVATKLFPGAIFVLGLFPRRSWRQYLLGMTVGLVPVFFFLVASPIDFLTGTVLFNMVRPSDATSWLYGLSPSLSVGLRVLYVGILVGAFLYIWARKPGIKIRLGLITFLLVLLLLSSPVNHRNYQLWWIPFYTLLVSTSLFGISQKEVKNGRMR